MNCMQEDRTSGTGDNSRNMGSTSQRSTSRPPIVQAIGGPLFLVSDHNLCCPMGANRDNESDGRQMIDPEQPFSTSDHDMNHAASATPTTWATTSDQEMMPMVSVDSQRSTVEAVGAHAAASVAVRHTSCVSCEAVPQFACHKCGQGMCLTHRRFWAGHVICDKCQEEVRSGTRVMLCVLM